jgi:serine/threonine protein phosphatase PrpC
METEDYKANNKSAESLAMAICKGFIATDKALQMNPEYAASCDEIGSTGLLAFVTPTDIIVGNVGKY